MKVKNQYLKILEYLHLSFNKWPSLQYKFWVSLWNHNNGVYVRWIHEMYLYAASHFKLKKSTDKALVCLYEIYFICVIHLINWGLF